MWGGWGGAGDLAFSLDKNMVVIKDKLICLYTGGMAQF